MNTRGIFSWLFPDDEEFLEGEPLDVWLLNNGNWLYDLFSEEGIPFDEQHARWFYEAVNAQDWRCGSCGGCL
ncbi:hypothetical protein QP938_09935 [Porticoccaceae bacterium LTM1]|nr:hypothetical protein QP938_09935 [Porticoccaceae bacterium LTM1]